MNDPTYEQKLTEWWREHGQELLRLLATQPKPPAETPENAGKRWNDYSEADRWPMTD